MRTMVGPLATAALIAVSTVGGFLPALAYPGQQYAKYAKITMSKAKSVALKTYPGKIVSAELEREHGGSGLRYSFDIKHGKVTHEVGIDAKTGRVLENSIEGPNSD